MPPELTPTRQHLLTAVLKLGPQATLDRLAHELGHTKQAISYQAKILVTLGYLEERHTRYGPLVPTPRTRLVLGQGIPIYGEIAAGVPTLAEQNPDDYTPTIEELLGMKEGDFLLKVRGDSMIGIGVMPGDHVVIRPTQLVHDGEVAVVLVPGENTATLKRFYHFGDEVILRSENPHLAQMSYPAEQVRVQGRMIGRVGGVMHPGPRSR